MWRLLLICLMILIRQSTAIQRGASYPRNAEECGLANTLTVFQTLPVGKPVYGVQPIGDEIFVVRDSTAYIEVYDRNTFQRKRSITVDSLHYPYDMVQSTQSPASLFITDWSSPDNITVVQIPQETVSTWPVKEDTASSLGLAGSNRYTDGNILVTASTSHRLTKFSSSGNTIAEITIQNISSPRHSIQVGADRHAVCHGYGPSPELHRVCLIDNSGVITKCYGGSVGQLDVPARLELLGTIGCILVADSGNKKLVLLNGDLDFVSDLVSTGLDGPYRLFLDDTNALLYVADNIRDADGNAISGRVVVYKM